MIRKAVIFICLITAYLFQLGHDMIPHHHHDDEHVAVAHHHDDDHLAVTHHHHDHPESGNQEKKDHSTLPELFSHFVHAPYNLSGSTQIEFKIKCAQISTDVAITRLTLLPLPDVVPQTAYHPDDGSRLTSVLLSHSLPERAPPTC